MSNSYMLREQCSFLSREGWSCDGSHAWNPSLMWEKEAFLSDHLNFFPKKYNCMAIMHSAYTRNFCYFITKDPTWSFVSCQWSDLIAKWLFPDFKRKGGTKNERQSSNPQGPLIVFKLKNDRPTVIKASFE